MIFIKDKDIYKVARITGVQDNVLGVSFTKEKRSIEIVEWHTKEGVEKKSSSDEVLKQVLDGLEEINKELGMKYRLSKVFFLPTDSASNSVYKYLIHEIVRRVAGNGDFEILQDTL